MPLGGGYKVYREFRTQRRPLNVAFFLRRTVEQETLYPAPPVGGPHPYDYSVMFGSASTSNGEISPRSNLRRATSAIINLSWLFILGGVILGMNQTLLNVGILLFSLAVIFQLVTLPVEFNASSRALRILGSTGIMYEDEVGQTRKVLSAAALTYVAGAASALLSLLRLVILFGGRDND